MTLDCFIFFKFLTLRAKAYRGFSVGKVSDYFLTCPLYFTVNINNLSDATNYKSYFLHCEGFSEKKHKVYVA
jgi:hypothetical protein